jgi:HD-like signal output (HDOD) protein
MFSENDLKQVVKGLPQLPKGVVNALILIEQGEVDIEQVADALETNIAVTTHLLKVANSPFYGFSREISSVKEACMIIGLQSVRNILIMSSAAKKFPASTGNCISLKDLWMHCLGTAAAAKIIASLTLQNQEVCFMAGMLHEIGNMVLDTYYSEELSRVIDHQQKNDCYLRQSQLEILGVEHNIIGAELIKMWKLPLEIELAVRDYAAPVEASGRIADVLHIAHIISKALYLGNSGDPFIPQITPETLSRLNINLEQIAENFDKIEKLTGEAATTLLK